MYYKQTTGMRKVEEGVFLRQFAVGCPSSGKCRVSHITTIGDDLGTLLAIKTTASRKVDGLDISAFNECKFNLELIDMVPPLSNSRDTARKAHAFVLMDLLPFFFFKEDLAAVYIKPWFSFDSISKVDLRIAEIVQHQKWAVGDRNETGSFSTTILYEV